MTIEKRTSYNPRACGALCDECPLNGQTVVPPESHANARVALIGEAPGEPEEKHGRPFVGPNGTELDRAIRASGHHRGKFHLTYTILCRPPDNDLAQMTRGLSKQAKLTGQVMKTPQECCAPRLNAEIAHIRDLIPLGKTAMQAVTGSSQSILAVRGALVELESTIRTLPRRVLPTVSPGLVQKQQRWAHVFRSDISKAMRAFNGLSGWVEPDIVYHPSAAEFRQFIDTDNLWTYDIETDGIEPLDANIRCIAIGNETKVMVIGLRSNKQPKEVPGLFIDFYDEEEASAMLRELRYFFENENIHKIGHNSGSYDRTVIRRRLGFDVKPNIDTIMIHRNVDPEMPHSLAYVASLYTDAPAWKCYDGETEILTDRGFVRFPDLEESDLVAQWDDGVISFVAPSAYVNQPYKGEMRSFKSQAVDLLVTPNHKMLYRIDDKSKWLVASPAEVPDGAEWVTGTENKSGIALKIVRVGHLERDEVDFDGRVYCVTVPSGFVVVRRNGKVVVSGNSDREGNKIAHGGENDHQLHEYAARDVAVTARVLPPLLDALEARDQLNVYKLDMQIQEICMVMHTTGMFVDQAIRHKKEVELLTLRHNLLHQIRDTTGIRSFNPASVNHLRDLLFDRWKLSTEFIDEEDRYTESGDLSTGDYILRGLLTDGQIEEDHRAVIKLIRRYRKCQKVLGTYVVKLRPSNMGADLGWDEDEDWVDKETRKQYGEEKRGIVNPATGRMYPGYSAHIAATGRLSSSKPINCFDAETEILTEIGWVRFDVLLESHQGKLKVAQWHEDGKIDFSLPTAYHCGRHTGCMIYIEDEKVDLLMTPNHRIPFRFSDANFPLLHNEVLTLTASEIHQLHRLVNRNKKSFPLRFIHPEEDIRITEDWSCKEVDYDGMVYCVTVPSDAIVVRRKGKVTITRQSQNFPKAMRSMIVPQPGHVLVGADMDQLELRVAAARWGVELYLRAFREGKDPHGMTAYAVFGNDFCRAAGVDPSCYAGNGMLVGKAYDEKGKFIGKGEAKTFRDLSKGVQYCSQYMGSAETTHKLIRKTEVPASDPVTKEPLNDGTTDLPYAKLPLQKVRVMQENWLRGAPQFKTGWQAEIETYRKKGYLREPVTGRRRDFLDGEKANEIVNFPIQCVPGNVRVITKNGYVPIRELEGLRFEAWTGKKWARATCIRKGTVPLLRVNTNHAASLLCDATHKFRVVGRSEYEWREADSLVVGLDEVEFNTAQSLEFGKDIDESIFSAMIFGWSRSGNIEVPEIVWRSSLKNRTHFLLEFDVTRKNETDVPQAVPKALSKALQREIELLRNVTFADLSKNTKTVSSITPEEREEPVFTLCVDDEEHCYVAEGFISKNSSAAAIMNLAMVKLYEQIPLHKWGPGTGIINQCHDAIVIECPEGEGERVARLLEECMNQVHDSLPGVEFTASADIGKSWDKV